MEVRKLSTKLILTTGIVLALYLTFTAFITPYQNLTSAYETTCPDYMDAQQCLEFLQQQADAIQKEQNQLDQSIRAENMEQMTLSEQINYIANKIRDTELNIATKELDIETKNIEIRLLTEDIVTVQTSIDTLVQEINRLSEIINERTVASYKLKFVSPLEIILDSKNFESMMRRTKYLIETKKKDRQLLSDMAVSKDKLEEEEIILNEKRAEVQEKRNSVESQLAELAQDRKSLQAQRAQQAQLLAESKRRENDLLEALNANRDAQAAVDQAIIQKIQELWDSGEIGDGAPISAGTVIGRMGNTGFSSGAHLHFSIDDGNSWVCFGNINPWSGYFQKGPDYWAQSGGCYYYYVYPVSVHAPLQGRAILTQDHHQGTAIDMVAVDSSGRLIGEGALVYSIKGGIYWSNVDGYGGKYVVVQHHDGTRSCYLHLQ